MNYSISERIFTYTGPNSLRPIAVFAVSDLADAECSILKTSVQRHLDVLNDSLGHGPFAFEVGPSATSDLPSFIVLKTELAENMRELEKRRGQPLDTWQWEIGLIHDIANGHADTIRSLRSHATSTEDAPTVGGSAQPQSPIASTPPPEAKARLTRFQVEDEDSGGRLVILETAGAQKWGPQTEHEGTPDCEGIFEWTYSDYLHRLPTGLFVRIRYKSHCEANLSFDPSLKRFSNAEAAEWLLFGGFDLPDDIAPLADEHRFTEEPRPALPTPSDESAAAWLADVDTPTADEPAKPPLDPSEELKTSYRDPDNYWRNVWLYQLKNSGKTNTEIIAALDDVAFERQFTPILEAALIDAIDAIAEHHGWTKLRGRPGRRRKGDRRGTDRGADKRGV